MNAKTPEQWADWFESKNLITLDEYARAIMAECFANAAEISRWRAGGEAIAKAIEAEARRLGV